MKRVLLWWARWRLNANRCDLNKALRTTAGPVFIANQLQNINNLEHRIAVLSIESTS